MITENTNNQNLYSLIPENKANSNFDLTLSKKRTLIGRSRVCDIVLPHSDISNIHAVIEIVEDGLKIYDMNSTGGTFVNDEKIVAKIIKVGDSFRLASHTFKCSPYGRDIAPPPLEMLIPIMDGSAPVPVVDSGPSLPKEKPEAVSPVIPRVEYPLAKDPRAEFSEYIFEDIDQLYPIFKYDFSQSSVEVIILFQGNIYSVDYIPIKDGKYRLVGEKPTSTDIEYPYLGKKDRFEFVEVRGGEVSIMPLRDYHCLTLSDELKELGTNTPIYLNDDDILRFEKGDLQVFVRKTSAPPKVIAPPILRRDKDFIKYLILILLFSLTFLTAMSLFTVDEELEKEKVPERLATILYRKKLVLSESRAIEKTKEAPKKVVQKSPQQKKTEPVKKPEVAKPKEPKKVTNVAKAGEKKSKNTAPAKKAQPRKGPTNKVTKVTPQKNAAKSASSSKKSTRSQRRSPVNKATQGNVDTFKSLNFESTVKNLLSKGGSTKAVGQASTGSAATANDSTSIGGSESATATRAALKPTTGSLSGVASGKLDSSKGVEGIIDKKNVYTAGLPFRRVVLGGMDPDIIKKILIAHIPQFRYCYQKVLDQSEAAFHGVVRLDFIIGASGNVTRASVASSSKNMPVSVKKCVSNVLKGISFPEPLGGGVVEVKQPFNFYPNIR